MKNLINYYYKLNILNIHQRERNYYFKINDELYCFVEYNECEKINEIYELSKYLEQFGIFGQLILNINNQIITEYNEKKYVLIKNIKIDTDITFNKIIEINNIRISTNKLKVLNWDELWSKKIDYFEYQISQIGKKYPLIRESFNYYLGLAELAISIISNVQKKDLYLCLSHRRIDDIYNPLNLIIDYRVRDVSEYFKKNFFENKDIIEELNLFLFNNNLTINEKQLFFVRMLFPTYYFDAYEDIITNKVSEDTIKKITIKVDEYEKILKKIYLHLKINSNLQIFWLENIS